jgi:hypothetical protein
LQRRAKFSEGMSKWPADFAKATTAKEGRKAKTPEKELNHEQNKH